MFHSEATYTAMECNPRSSSPAAIGTFLLKDEEIDPDSDDEDYSKEVPTQNRRRGKSLKCILAISFASVFVVGVAVAILVLVITALTTLPRNASSSAMSQSQTSSSAPLVTTVVPECGDTTKAVVCLGFQGGACKKKFVGSQENDIFVFKGIPYALPPTSDRRWKQPSSLNDDCIGNQEDRPFYAQLFGSKCLQLGRDSTRFEGSEDCLYLNVWTPNLSSEASLPVMVYFHGGGLISGSGHENGTVPTSNLVSAADMVFVTFNYRLNAFGFMAVEPLAKDGASGNYGFMDQILALRWIHDNIKVFGGNPNKVTVFGHGSGATSIYALLASKEATGLFQKAWLASPSPKLENSLKDAYKQNAKFLNDTDCGGGLLEDQLACLLNLSAEKILQAIPWNSWKNLHFYRLPLKTERSAIIAAVDGFVLKSSPLEA